MIILAVALLTPPVPPPAPIRTTPLPEYTAECRLIGQDTEDQRLAVSVSGSGDTRRMVLSATSEPLSMLETAAQKPTTMSLQGPTQLWQTTDVMKARLGTKPVVVWLEVEPDIARGAEIRIEDDGRMGLALFAGMCRVKPFDVGSAR